MAIDHHIVPLSKEALDIIKVVPRGDREQVFGRGPGGFKGWVAAKQALDARIGAAAEASPLPHWVVHDIRRSVVALLVESRRNGKGKGDSFTKPPVAEARFCRLSLVAKVAGN